MQNKSFIAARRRYFVRYCWEGESLTDGRTHTWDVVDRQGDKVVHNVDSRAAARASCAQYNAEHEASATQGAA